MVLRLYCIRLVLESDALKDLANFSLTIGSLNSFNCGVTVLSSFLNVWCVSCSLTVLFEAEKALVLKEAVC